MSITTHQVSKMRQLRQKHRFKSVNNLITALEDRFENDSANYSKAMSAFTRQRDITVNSSDAVIRKALHTFAKENTTAGVPGKKKNSGSTPVQSKSKQGENIQCQVVEVV